jgi:hypothetical protein
MYIEKWKINKEKINIIFNTYNINSTQISILKNTFNEFKILEKIPEKI